MQGKATNPIDKIKVISAKLANPNASLREIERDTGVDKSTVDNIIKEGLPEMTLETLDKANNLFDANIDIINTGVKKIRLAMKLLDPETIRETKEYQEIVNTAFKQNQLISGKATDRVEVVDISLMTPQQISDYIAGKQ